MFINRVPIVPERPLTTTRAHAVCGTDDLYTRCSGSYAYGIDGDAIRCKGKYKCVTQSIYENWDSYNPSIYTPFIGCGLSTATLEIIRTTEGSSGSSSGRTSTCTGGGFSCSTTTTIGPAATTLCGSDEVTLGVCGSGKGTSMGGKSVRVPGYMAFCAWACLVLWEGIR
ncbi:hypothetical protein BJ875DRAFT_476215 [Amylocarpus encephaloides]|uniref:Uncharacterized protein n=1 Tax=Amylocarpus encephaloides TaxID=45428 RepID=A0A9P7Y8Y7_9HELO|nr:hypothetical protein BJ875DRAFT_476215 [Amylocarpus encephaloides]